MALAVGFEIDELCVKQNRLDLGRAGIVPNPKRMATEQGAYYAENIYLIDELNMAEQWENNNCNAILLTKKNG